MGRWHLLAQRAGPRLFSLIISHGYRLLVGTEVLRLLSERARRGSAEGTEVEVVDAATGLQRLVKRYQSLETSERGERD